MILLVVLIISLTLVGAVILRLKLELGILAQKDGTDDQVTVDVSIPPILHRQISIPVAELVEKHGQLATRFLEKVESGPRKEHVSTLSEQQEQIRKVWSLMRQIRQSGMLRTKDAPSNQLKWVAMAATIGPNLQIKVKEFTLWSRIGLGDAALTGVGTGLAWSVLSTAVSLLQQHFRVQFVTPPQVAITPEFNDWLFQGRLRCIVSLRVGEIILEGAKHLIRLRTFRRDSSGRTTSH